MAVVSQSNRCLPAVVVCDRFGITERTLHRWLRDPRLEFPRPILINTRRYFREEEIASWETRRLAGEEGCR